MNALTELSLTSLAAGMRAGAFSSRDIVEACLRRIDALDPQLNAFLRVESEAALIEAEACDRELAAGKPRGPLHGLPVRSEEHTSELQSLMRISYAVFCLKKTIQPYPRT